MLHVSDEWKAYTEDNHNFEIKAVLTLEDGTVFNLTGDDFMSACINDAVSDKDSITIGAVITNRFSGSLNNMEDKFTGLDLEGATLDVKVGLIYEDLTEEWLDKGIYILDQPSAMGDVLQISAYDYMDKMNRFYLGMHPVEGGQAQITFPIDSETLASYLCDYCGVSYEADFWKIANNLQVEEFEFNESTTCREVLSWVLQINCGYARINNVGKLEVNWIGGEGYWSTADALEGGTFQPWSGADNADGGVMDPWAVVPDVNGGYICVAVDKVLSVDMSAKDVKITGIRAYAYNTVNEFDFSTSGSTGYVIAIQGNPLISAEKTTEVANAVNGTINGMGFRPYDARIEANPCLEAGDTIALMDYKGQYHISIITNLTFNWGAAMSISAGAESVTKKDLELSNPTTSVIQGAVTAAYDNIIAKKLSADYISAGTIEASIVAKDLTMDGGSVNLTTNDASEDVISLQYGDDVATMRGGHFEVRTSNSDTLRGELGVSSDTHAALKIYNASGNCVSNQGENAYGGGLQCNNTTGDVRCLLAPSSLGSGALMLYNASDVRTLAFDAYAPQIALWNASSNKILDITAQSLSTPHGQIWIYNSSGTNTISLQGSNGALFASSYNNMSMLDIKKNVKKAETMLSKIVDADILSFNFKDEEKDAKPHLGLAIGGEYNVPDEIVAESDDGEQSGVDLYSMVSMAWKAIQEQQEIIEALEARVEALEKKLNPIGTIKDIIKGDTDGNTN